MAQYTHTGAANLLNTPQSPPLVLRVQDGLIKYAASQYASATGNALTYVRNIGANPAGAANAVLPLLVAIVNVTTPGTDSAPIAPLDSEITTAISTLWPFLTT